MNRLKKLIKNVSLIFIILILFYYYGGFFLSKESLIEDKMKSIYSTADEFIVEFNNKNNYKTLYVDFDTMSYSLIETKKIGFLWIDDGSSSSNFELDRAFDIEGGYSSNFGTYIIILRNNENIDYITCDLENNESYIFYNWTKNISYIFIESGDWYNGIYKAYDVNNNLIEEIEY